MTTAHLDTSPLPPSTRQGEPLRHRVGGLTLALGGIVLIAGLIIAPGPDIADVHAATWVPGHALNAIGFLLLAIGLPSVAGSLGRRLGVLGAIGYATLMVRFVLSTGSHLYSMWILPTLAKYPDLHDETRGQGRLARIYADNGDLINVAVAVGLLGLVVAFWRCGRLRVVALLLLLAAIGEGIGNPVSLLLFAVVAIWLGLRLIVRDDVSRQLRSPKTAR